jgi:chromosome condensin MukBEF ATPase and DNA-binding subunit MukB
MSHYKVKDLADLKAKAKGKEQLDCFISFGVMRSSKTFLNISDESITLFNEIDGTEQELKWEDLFDSEQTNIGEAITKGAFYIYEYVKVE